MKSILHVLLVGILSFNAVGASITYDAAAQFTTTSNPAGVWSYGYSPGGTGFTPFSANYNGVV